MSAPINKVVDKLIEYIQEGLVGTDFEGATIIDEFPYPGGEYDYPTISISTVGDGDFQNYMPTIHSKEDHETDDTKLNVVYNMGQYNLNLQIDLWCEYKAQREAFYQVFMDIMDTQFFENDAPAGLSLVLPDYFDAIARYDQVSYNYMDGEESSQRSEWRVMIRIITTFPRLKKKVASKIKEAIIKHNVSDTLIDDTNEETKPVF